MHSRCLGTGGPADEPVGTYPSLLLSVRWPVEPSSQTFVIAEIKANIIFKRSLIVLPV